MRRGTKWEGGFVYTDGHGRPVYLIRRQLGGRRYEVSTRCTDIESARAQLRRFEENPAAYTPAPAPEQALTLTAKLAEQFLTWSRDTKGNTREWVHAQKRSLTWWAKQLVDRDLRHLDVREDLLRPLERAPGRHHRVAVLKAFYGWLRTEKHLVKLAEDPEIGRAHV